MLSLVLAFGAMKSPFTQDLVRPYNMAILKSFSYARHNFRLPLFKNKIVGADKL